MLSLSPSQIQSIFKTKTYETVNHEVSNPFSREFFRISRDGSSSLPSCVSFSISLPAASGRNRRRVLSLPGSDFKPIPSEAKPKASKPSANTSKATCNHIMYHFTSCLARAPNNALCGTASTFFSMSNDSSRS